MNEEVEQECNLTLDSLSESEPMKVTAEPYIPYFCNGNVDCIELLDASESTKDRLLSSTAAVVVDQQLRRVISTEENGPSIYLKIAPSPF